MSRPIVRLLAVVIFISFISGAGATPAAAQESHDALATARAKAAAQNQRILLLLTGDDSDTEQALVKALATYEALGHLLKWEYQLAAVPDESLAGGALRARLQLGDAATPVVAALDTSERVLGTLHGADLDIADVESFMKQHAAKPVDARKSLVDAIGVARRTDRRVFVYLSAPS